MSKVKKAAATELATKMGGMIPLLIPRWSSFEVFSILKVRYDEEGMLDLSSTDIALNDKHNEKHNFTKDIEALAQSIKTVNDDDQLIEVVKQGGEYGKSEDLEWTVALTDVTTTSIDVDAAAFQTFLDKHMEEIILKNFALELWQYLEPPRPPTITTTADGVVHKLYFNPPDFHGRSKREVVAFVVESKKGNAVIERKKSKKAGFQSSFLGINFWLDKSNEDRHWIKCTGVVGVGIMICKIEIDTNRKLTVVSVDSIQDPNDRRLAEYMDWAERGRLGRAREKLGRKIKELKASLLPGHDEISKEEK